MKKKISFLEIIAIILAVCLIIFPLFLIVIYKPIVNSKLDLISVPYSTTTIMPGTKIKTNMIGTKQVPKSSLKGNYYLELSEIEGKCTRMDAIIPAGSIYYRDLLTDCSNNRIGE